MAGEDLSPEAEEALRYFKTLAAIVDTGDYPVKEVVEAMQQAEGGNKDRIVYTFTGSALPNPLLDGILESLQKSTTVNNP